MTKRKTKGKETDTSSGLHDWISNLAKESVKDEQAVPLSKVDRIERRNAKKRRRLEQGYMPKHTSLRDRRRESENDETKTRKYREEAVRSLASLSNEILERTSSLKQKTFDATVLSKHAVKHRKLRWEQDHIQPRIRDYGGIGLARKSVFFSLDDPALCPKLTEEFNEHVPGFFGRTKTKAMKRQIDGGMLWRRLAEQRSKGTDGKRMSALTSDEKVEAALAAGLL